MKAHSSVWFLVLSLMILVVSGCSREGEVYVYNYSDGDISGTVAGSRYALAAGETYKCTVDIGKAFIFGPDSKDVALRAGGDCVLPFSKNITVNNGEATKEYIYGDSGYIVICNTTYEELDIYLSPCYESSWGPVDGTIAAYDCMAFQVGEGCYDMLVDAYSSYADVYDIWVDVCEVRAFDYGTTACQAIQKPSSEIGKRTKSLDRKR